MATSAEQAQAEQIAKKRQSRSHNPVVDLGKSLSQPSAHSSRSTLSNVLSRFISQCCGVNDRASRTSEAVRATAAPACTSYDIAARVSKLMLLELAKPSSRYDMVVYPCVYRF